MKFADGLFLLFLGLKIAGFIAWSWWWVTSPLWISIILVVTLYIINEVVG